ncbi:hypothetical protein Cs7R123_01770 [Catellatospora sp. TT07R-123]|uniref:hypothetical protein n=1 Tax=Catellatospora sp. TT07R-123 TaxID=2733863 RepID=UPI001B089C67|nr:hypothetical protein [Catellatospora sp. TT07R-123]GHJ42835.1 hypothetical protein Cs7R123_01770 [Catellatospora sp. TT07R-123]
MRQTGLRASRAIIALAVAGLLASACGPGGKAGPGAAAFTLSADEVWQRLPVAHAWSSALGEQPVDWASTDRLDADDRIPVCAGSDENGVAQPSGASVTTFAAQYTNKEALESVTLIGSVTVLPDTAAAEAFGRTVTDAVKACGTVLPDASGMPTAAARLLYSPAPAKSDWAKVFDAYYTKPGSAAGIVTHNLAAVRGDGRVVVHLRTSHIVDDTPGFERHGSSDLHRAHLDLLLGLLDGSSSAELFGRRRDDIPCLIVPSSTVTDANKGADTYRFYDHRVELLPSCYHGQHDADTKQLVKVLTVLGTSSDTPPEGATVLRDKPVLATLRHAENGMQLTLQRTSAIEGDEKLDNAYGDLFPHYPHQIAFQIITMPDPGYSTEQWTALVDRILAPYQARA